MPVRVTAGSMTIAATRNASNRPNGHIGRTRDFPDTGAQTGGPVVGALTLNRWLELAADLLTRPTPDDPMTDVCRSSPRNWARRGSARDPGCGGRAGRAHRARGGGAEPAGSGVDRRRDLLPDN